MLQKLIKSINYRGLYEKTAFGNDFGKQFSHKALHNYCSKGFVVERFCHYLKKTKKDASFCLHKVIWWGADFLPKHFSEQTKHLGKCPSFGGNVGKT